tara:strand:+ start:361 stop:639 length:279 start_codon:yes stop_codon:yes gene_type:complete
MGLIARIEEQCGQLAYISPSANPVPWMGISMPKYHALNNTFRIIFKRRIEDTAVNINNTPNSRDNISPLKINMNASIPKSTIAAAFNATAKG